MINEISSSDVEVVIQDKDMVGAEEILQENQNRNCSEINIQYKGKELLRDVVELLSSSALGAGVGYLAGGMIRVIVDLAKNGKTACTNSICSSNGENFPLSKQPAL